MTQPRKNIISLSDTPYYHCIGRCVRRAFLCGKDKFSGQSFEHRRQWIIDRINHLNDAFAIDICAYSIMSNHYHLVLHLSPAQSRKWSQDEIIKRWKMLFSGGQLVRDYQSGKPFNKIQQNALNVQTEIWRERLTDISWFMRCLNEHIAILANKEDKCTGRFWEGRFKSQALLDDTALIGCMAYVDLNPIRANIANTPEQSDYTSVKERIQQLLGKPHAADKLVVMQGAAAKSEGLPIHIKDYLELVDWTGRAISCNKAGAIPYQLKPILQRLQVKPDNWIAQQKHFGKRYYLVAGTKEKVKSMALKIGIKWLNGQGSSSPYQIVS